MFDLNDEVMKITIHHIWETQKALKQSNFDTALIGGFAFGLQGGSRATADADIAVAHGDSPGAFAALKRSLTGATVTQQIGDATDPFACVIDIQFPSSMPIQVVVYKYQQPHLRRFKLAKLAIQSSEPIKAHGVELAILTKEGLAALKAETGALKDWKDVRQLLEQLDADLSGVLELLEQAGFNEENGADTISALFEARNPIKPK